MNNDMETWTGTRLMAYFEASANELKAQKVAPARDVDGRTGYAVCVDHIVFCALLRDDRVFMALSPSIIEVRRPDQPAEYRTAYYSGAIGVFILVP